MVDLKLKGRRRASLGPVGFDVCTWPPGRFFYKCMYIVNFFVCGVLSSFLGVCVCVYVQDMCVRVARVCLRQFDT